MKRIEKAPRPMVARLQPSLVFLRRRVDARLERSLAQALREPPRRGQAACDIAVYVFLFADKRLVGIIGVDAYRFSSFSQTARVFS